MQRRATGAEFPMPRQPAAKLKALRQTIQLIRREVKSKHWHQALYWLSRARALVNALPADRTTQEREQLAQLAQLAQLRKKYAARDTPAAQLARNTRKLTPAAKSSAKKSAAKRKQKKALAQARQKPEPAPLPDLGSRLINRAALGYGPTDGTQHPHTE